MMKLNQHWPSVSLLTPPSWAIAIDIFNEKCKEMVEYNNQIWSLSLKNCISHFYVSGNEWIFKRALPCDMVKNWLILFMFNFQVHAFDFTFKISSSACEAKFQHNLLYLTSIKIPIKHALLTIIFQHRFQLHLCKEFNLIW